MPKTPSKPGSKSNNASAELGLPVDAPIALLQALHILTPEGRINQDSRRKLKQVQHLVRFLTPLLDAAATQTSTSGRGPVLVDHGAGKSYLGFMLWDAWFAKRPEAQRGQVVGIEIRPDLIAKSTALAQQLGYSGMRFVELNTQDASHAAELSQTVDLVTALHACDTATDDAIAFGLKRGAAHIAVVPCCQAEVAGALRSGKALQMHKQPLSELWRHPHHTREFGAQITNVLRCLQLEAHGYQVTVTELVGWEHSMKNELIVASRHKDVARGRAAARLTEILQTTGLQGLAERFFLPPQAPAL